VSAFSDVCIIRRALKRANLASVVKFLRATDFSDEMLLIFSDEMVLNFSDETMVLDFSDEMVLNFSDEMVLNFSDEMVLNFSDEMLLNSYCYAKHKTEASDSFVT